VILFTQRRKVRKGCGFSRCILYAFERCAFAEAVGVIHTSPYVFFCFFCGKNSYKKSVNLWLKVAKANPDSCILIPDSFLNTIYF